MAGSPPPVGRTASADAGRPSRNSAHPPPGCGASQLPCRDDATAGRTERWRPSKHTRSNTVKRHQLRGNSMPFWCRSHSFCNRPAIVTLQSRYFSYGKGDSLSKLAAAESLLKITHAVISQQAASDPANAGVATRPVRLARTSSATWPWPRGTCPPPRDTSPQA